MESHRHGTPRSLPPVRTPNTPGAGSLADSSLSETQHRWRPSFSVITNSRKRGLKEFPIELHLSLVFRLE